MKFRIIVILAALAALVSCQREQETPDNPPASGDACSITVRASVPQEAVLPKTYLGTYAEKDKTVLWGTGEQMQLAVTAGGSNVFAASEATDAYDGEPQARFTFSVVLPEAASYLYQGIYPVSAVVAEDNSNPAAYKVVLPGVQEASATGYDPQAFLMVAQPTAFNSKATEWTASFRRAAALNVMTLQGIPAGKQVQRVALVAPEDVYLSGGRHINLSTGASASLYDGSRSVEVRYSTPLAGGADIEVWFTSWGAEFPVGSTFTVVAYTSDHYSITKEVTLPAGHPISLVEGKYNTFAVSLEGIAPAPCCFSGGSGTALDPWRIETVQDLLDMSAYVASSEPEEAAFKTACYRQGADIDFEGATLPSIGNTNAEPYSYFQGTYEGNGFKVSNVVVANPNADKANGFFGYLAGAAHVDGLCLENVTLSSTTWNNGAVVGCMQPSSTSVVENCVITGGSVSSNNTDNGGIVGKLMSGTVKNCSYAGTVSGTTSAKHRVGGIVGQVSSADCLVDGCYFDGIASGPCGNVGGIVGSLVGSSSVTNCSTSAETRVEGGSVSDNGINIGGIVGYITSATGGKVENCSFPGTVVGHYYEVGGIVGRNQGLVIRSCTFSGTVTSDWNESGATDDTYGRLGGICGHVHGTGYVESCQVSGNVGADDKRVSYTGGIVGWLEVGSVVGCSIPSGKTLVVKGKATVGGVVGQFKSGIVKSCTLNGLTLNSSGHYAGGGAGRMTPNASMTMCKLRNSTVSSGGMGAGGMCGLFQGGGYIAQCEVSGSSISAGTKLAGGILGNMDSCTSAATSKVERCTVTGGTGLVVSAGANGIAGGILGGCNTYGAINLCSASIDVRSAGGANVGGIVGWTSTPNIVIANCVYYGGELSAPSSSGVGGICGQFNSNVNEMGASTLVNCCAFPAKVTTSSANMAGIGGYVNTVTIRNCYSPALPTIFYKGSTHDGSGSAGSIYGWLRGKAAGDPCSGIMEDVYYLSGWKAGNYSGSYTYVKSEQALTDAQMKNTGAVSRPSTGVAYGSFLEALNAGADAYNAAAPVFGIQAAEWVMGTNGYPVPFGTALDDGSTVSSKKRVSLLGDSITTYQGYTTLPNNYEYPKASSYPDFTSVTQTWWYQLIYNRMTGAKLEVNSSITGTCVQNTTSTGHPGYGFLNRYEELGNPDVILINGGTNDISRGLPVGSPDFSIATEDLDTYQFAQAYDKLIRLLKARYPSATICVVLGDRFFDGKSAAHASVLIEICTHHGIPYAQVDYGENRSTCRYSEGTNVHPTPAGMTFMADAIWDQLQSVL